MTAAVEVHGGVERSASGRGLAPRQRRAGHHARWGRGPDRRGRGRRAGRAPGDAARGARGPGAVGEFTENGNRIGAITLGGSLGLIVGGGLFIGFGAGFVWVTVRPWIPGGTAVRALLAMPIAVALGSIGLIDGDNHDFEVLGAATRRRRHPRRRS